MPVAMFSVAMEPLASRLQPLEAAVAEQALPAGPVVLQRTASGTGPYAERITALAALLDGASLTTHSAGSCPLSLEQRHAMHPLSCA